MAKEFQSCGLLDDVTVSRNKFGRSIEGVLDTQEAGNLLTRAG
jgi:hypothetical protein